MNDKQIAELLELFPEDTAPVEALWSGDPQEIAGITSECSGGHKIFLAHGHGYFVMQAVAAFNLAPDLAREVLRLREELQKARFQHAEALAELERWKRGYKLGG